MPLDDRTLSRVQAWATICAAVVIPLVVAFFGWQIQSRLSDDSLKKDYVRMAIEILANPQTKDNESLRMWATQILEKNSPVPFTTAVRDDFLKGGLVYVPVIPPSLLKSPLMEGPKPWKYIDKKDPITNGDLLENYFENKAMFEQNAIMLQYLQQVLRDMAAPSDSSQSEPEQDTKPSNQPLHPTPSAAELPRRG